MTIETGDGQIDEAGFGGRQAKVVFALLVTERHRAVPREELAEALWGERLPSSWEAALRVVVSRVRSVLARAGLPPAQALTNAFGCYQIHLPPDARVDLELAASAVTAAEDALAIGDASQACNSALVARAIAARPFLSGEAGEWARRTRDRVQGIRLRALEVLVLGHAGRGDAVAALEAAEEAVALDPFRESAHRCLMKAHAAAGNRAAGLKAYERCRRLLAQELGVAPSGETEAAYIALLGAVPSPAAVSGTASPVRHDADFQACVPDVLRAGGPELVGRGPELLRVERLWSIVHERRRQVVFLAGEAGIGKTALAGAVARDLHARGATALYGRCDKEILVPYQPFVEAVDRYVQACPLDRLRAEVGPGGADLARLVVDLPRRLPELALPPPAEPETERHRLFGAVAGFLKAVARTAPVVIVFDDFQWAATATLVLFRHVIRALELTTSLVIVCYRDDEVDTRSALTDLVSDVMRDAGAHRIDLSGLDEKAVAEMVRSASPGVEVGAGCVARTIQEQTAGNPLFVTEMLRHLLDTGWSPDVDLTPAEVAGALGHVPRTVHEVIGRRYSGISDRARQVLDVAAVVGPRFAIGVLRQVSGLDEELLLDALDETSRARLTREIPDLIGSYGFAHAISRDVIYARLSAARRSYLHRRVAEAVERRPGSRSGGAFAELAYHFQAAGEPEKAARYAIEAGDHAFGCSAYEGAARYYESALHLGLAAPQQQQQRCRTLMALAAAQRKAGQVASAREAYLEATRLARDLADPEALAGCALGLAGGGRGVSAWIADEVRISLLEEALAVLGSGDSELRVKVLTELAKVLYFSQEAERRDALASEAVDVARRLGTATVVAGALSATRVIRWGPANTELRLAYGDEVLALSEQSGDAELVVRARLARLVDLIEMGSRPSVDREVDSILDLAGCLHQPYYLWRAISWDAHRALMDGRVRTAEQRSVDALAAWGGDPHEDAMQCGRIQLATLAVMQGRASEAVGLLRPVAEAHPMIPSYRCLLAFILSKAGRAFEARAEFERFAADGFLSPPVDGNWLLGIGALAETCAYLQDRPRAKVLYELLTPFGDRMLVFDAFGGGGSFWGSAAHQLGLLAATTGAIEVAERHLRAALEANTRFGARHAVARTERALGALATIVGTQG